MTQDASYPAAPSGTVPALVHRAKWAFEQLDRQSLASFSQVLIIFVALALVSAPFGWSGNEENYFPLAYQTVAPERFGPWSAIFDHSYDRIVGFRLLGHLIGLVGYGPAHFILSLVAPLLLAHALHRLSHWLGLSVIDSLVAVALFCLCGQTLMGGEWIFGGVETKTFGYGCGLLTFVDGGLGRIRWAIFWCTLAIYLHFLVGAFWLGATCLLMCFHEPGWKKAAALAGGAAILSAPLAAIILVGQLPDLTIAPPAGMPTADYVYSIIRNPHHVAPFAKVDGFLRELVLGLGYAGLMTVGALSIATLSHGRTRALALVVMCLMPCLLLAATLSWFDRHTGHLGRFYLFRPASPLLLLGFFLGIAAWRPLTIHTPTARMFPTAVILAIFAVQALTHRYNRREGPPDGPTQDMIMAVRALTAPSDPILLDPATDRRAGTTRELQRQTIVNWKFVPTNPADIYRWWGMIERRAAVFAGDCSAIEPAARYIVPTSADRPRVTRCGTTLWSNAGYALIKVH